MARLAPAIAVAVLLWPAVAATQPDSDINPLGRISKQTQEVEACSDSTTEGADTAVARASEHFDRAGELYEQGLYELAITEYAIAYCHKPHHSILKNIAQAFERLTQYEKAVAYLERYILELPDSEQRERERTSFRVGVLRQQPARIQVATFPSEATITLTDENGLAAKEEANEPILVRRGVYTLKVEKTGFKPVTREIVAHIGLPYSYYIQLEPLKGSVRISASPSNARIFLNNRLVGLGSYVETVPIGTYQLMVEAKNRPSKSQSFEVIGNRTTNLRVALDKPPRSGRRELLVASTLMGGLIGTSVLQTAFEENGLTALGGGIGIGIGFAGGYFGIPDQIPVGTTSMITGTTFIGALEAGLVANYFACDAVKDDQGDYEDDCVDERVEIVTGVSVATAMISAMGSTLLANHIEPQDGRVALVHSGAIWGAITGAFFWSVFDNDVRIREPLVLAGLNLGLISSALLAPRIEISRARTALIDLSGLAGMAAGIAIAEAAKETGNERLDHFALAGIGTGLIAGTLLTRFMDEPKALGQLTPQGSAAKDVSGRITPTLGLAAQF